MYLEIQSLPISKITITPTNFSPSAHYTKSLSNSRISFGFCTSSKTMSKPLISYSGNNGGLVGVRCRCQGGGAPGKDEHSDGFYMRRGVELARKAMGHTSPNPMVGCVIVKDGKVVGEGFHPKAGLPHAEVFALRDAGDLAENGTAYVTLEPCNHYGRTPPCTEALIKAKVKKVVVGMVDPNPIVASKGVDRLRDAGIDVTVGVEEERCKKLNEAYIHQMLTGKPFVTLRYSLSVDGFLTDELGEGVTESGGYYSQLLQENDAVILSSTSVEKYSFPLSNESRVNQPLQIILVKNPTSPIRVPVIPSDVTSKVIIFTDRETSVEQETAQQGIEIVVLERLSLNAILEYCKGRGVCSILVDLRGNLDDYEDVLSEGLEHNLIQKFVAEALPVSGGSKEEKFTTTLRNLVKSLSLKNLNTRVPGKNLLLEGYLLQK